MKVQARKIALKLLIEYEERHTFPNLALKEALRRIDEERDRRFITALVYGVLERKITLDDFISKCCDKKMSSLSLCVLSVLRMGVYQLFYMDVPPSAACNTSVDLVKEEGFSYSAGFVNAVLRRCQREKENLMLMKKASFSVRYSISPYLVDLLLEQYGKEKFIDMMERGCGREEYIYLFHNAKKCSTEEFIGFLENEKISLEKTDLPQLYKTKSTFSVDQSGAYQKGYYHVIGYHSAMAALLMPQNAKNILDLCAAPGGKTFAMASRTEGEIRAFDLHPHKVDLLKKNAERMGHCNVLTQLGDSSVFNPDLCGTADFILCDVPCSGLGMMGKKPDIKYKEYDGADLRDIQYNILKNAASYLKDGGRLVYSTCTIDRRENELQINRFLENHAEFSRDFSDFPEGEQLFLPNSDGDGFYIAVLKKGK